MVWKGKNTGVFLSWVDCKKQVDGFKGAKYKSFADRQEAEIAFSRSFDDYKGVDTKARKMSKSEIKKYGTPILNSVSVDAACSGNPGTVEYRGVLTQSKKQIFIEGPFKNGTNNIGEFLALAHCIALLKNKNKEDVPIYSDSKIAIKWIKEKHCYTNLRFDNSNKELKVLIKRAEEWLKNNTFNNTILKWETKVWGEIPADFGRK